MSNERLSDGVEDVYASPVLSDYGTIEAWTQGTMAQAIIISIVI